MFGRMKDLPGPSEAVHEVRRGTRSLCGQSMKGEAVLPPDTPVTCPGCKSKSKR